MSASLVFLFSEIGNSRLFGSAFVTISTTHLISLTAPTASPGRRWTSGWKETLWLDICNLPPEFLGSLSCRYSGHL